MIKYVFFDLDGTLLGMDEKKFISIYVSTLYEHIFNKEKYTIKEVGKIIMSALQEVVDDLDSEFSNLEKYYHHFKKYLKNDDVSIEEYISKFDSYYVSPAFLKCQDGTKRNENMVKAVSLLKSKGYKLAVTTNPFFPREAIFKRIEWAGLDINDFELVTVGEESHFLKPNLQYYQEILRKLEIKENSEVLMVGNDVEEDMIASELGLNTYLVKDYLISRYGNEDKIVNQGSSEDFLKYVEENL